MKKEEGDTRGQTPGSPSDSRTASQPEVVRAPAPNRLTFDEVAAASLSRANRWHVGGVTDWSAMEWAAAMAGEAGEACNAAKKLKRIDDGLKNINTEEGRSLTDRKLACHQVAKEVADTFIYGMLLVAAVDEDLAATLIEVFNKKSEEYGFPERLVAPAAPRAAEKVRGTDSCANCRHWRKHHTVAGCVAIDSGGACPCREFASPGDREEQP